MYVTVPDTVSVTATPQRVTGFAQGQPCTLRNTHRVNSVHYIENTKDMPAYTSFAGTMAELRTLGGSELKGGECVVLYPAIGTLVMARGSDSGNATVNIECGILASTPGPLEPDSDMDIADQSKKHTHTAAGSAEEISGDTAFTAGTVVEIVGIDTWVAVGDDAAQAQGGDTKYPPGVPFRVALATGETTFYLDAAPGGEVSIHQVRA